MTDEHGTDCDLCRRSVKHEHPLNQNAHAGQAPAEDPIFGPIISSYSRAQAIDDGFLVDVSQTAREAGIKWPTALTRAVYDRYVAIPDAVVGQDVRGRLWDIVMMYRFAVGRSRTAGDTLLFKLHVRNSNRGGTPPLVTLKAIAGPGDTAEPVITIMMPQED